MTCNTIYETALALLGEPRDSLSCTDYRSRSPLLLRIITSRLAPVSKHFNGKDVPTEEVTLISDFPLDIRLAPCASEMLASMLIFDELPELAESLMKQAQSDLSFLAPSAAKYEIGSTREVYGS